MRELTDIISAVSNASGSIAKLSILAKHKDNSKLKAVLKFIYDPYNKCGIGMNKLTKALGRTTPNDVTDPLLVIRYLTKYNTGADGAVNYAAGFVHTANKCGQDAAGLAMAIVLQDLQMGLGLKSLNQVFGADFIPTVGCMLGTLYGDVSIVKWPCIVTEKLDGIRRILIKQDGVVKMFSRSGHEDAGCVDILEEAKHLPDNYMYDGELLAIGNFKNNIEWRQATNSIANSKGIKRGLTFNVFDMVLVDEFYTGSSIMKALNRKILLGATMGDEDGIACLTDDWARYSIAYGLNIDFKYIKPVPILGLAHSMEQVTPTVEAIWKNHGEGVMLNTVSGVYAVKRSRELLKVKFSEEKVLPIVGFVEGTNKYENMLGAVVIDYKGSNVGVGSGFTDYERIVIWNNKEEYLGKLVEVETFGESKNIAGGISLNCPIFKRFVGQEE